MSGLFRPKEPTRDHAPGSEQSGGDALHSSSSRQRPLSLSSFQGPPKVAPAAKPAQSAVHKAIFIGHFRLAGGARARGGFISI
jgi:hypothetical protein